jgi:TolB-like protein
MSSRGLAVAALALVLLAGGAASAAKPRIAVVGLAVEKAGPGMREKLDAAVADGLTASGADVVDAVETARKMAARGSGACRTSSCLAALAQEISAKYLVRGSVDVDGRSYVVHLEMVDGATGSVIAEREDRCEVCTESEAYETAGMTASALKAAVSKRRAASDERAGATTPAPAAAPQGALAASPPADPAPGVAIAAAPSRAAAEPPGSRALPIAAIGAGLAALGAGIALIVIDGQGTCTTTLPGELCERRYRTRTGGIVASGLGIVAAGLGATLLIKRF